MVFLCLQRYRFLRTECRSHLEGCLVGCDDGFEDEGCDDGRNVGAVVGLKVGELRLQAELEAAMPKGEFELHLEIAEHEDDQAAASVEQHELTAFFKHPWNFGPAVYGNTGAL